MDTFLSQVKRFVEGTDLVANVQEDIQAIQGTDVQNIVDSVYDLRFALKNESEYQDLINDPYAGASSLLAKTTQDTETYLKGIKLQVEQPGKAGQYLDLYAVADWTKYPFGPMTMNPENLWDALNDPVGTISTRTMAHPYQGTDWAGHIPYTEYKWTDKHGTKKHKRYSAEDSFTHWIPYLHITAGNASALNADGFMA